MILAVRHFLAFSWRCLWIVYAICGTIQKHRGAISWGKARGWASHVLRINSRWLSVFLEPDFVSHLCQFVSGEIPRICRSSSTWLKNKSKPCNRQKVITWQQPSRSFWVIIWIIFGRLSKICERLGGRIDLVLDNAGFESYCDMVYGLWYSICTAPCSWRARTQPNCCRVALLSRFASMVNGILDLSPM